jgi:3',5'-cyclic AMP phosphodiesterase CpdA
VGISVFAVEPGAVQLHWARLPAGRHEVTVGPATAVVEADGRPGAVVLDGLTPATTHPVTLDGAVVAHATTLAQPPGRPLTRVATMTDLHLGETAFGHLPRVRSSADPAKAHPVVCARAAVAELVAWGAELLVLKGDLAHDNHGCEYELAGAVLDGIGIPVMVLPGNHDGGNHRNDDARPALARHGLHLVDGVAAADLPGLRVVGMDSTLPGRASSNLDHRRAEVAAALDGAPGGALVALHHQLMPGRVPTHVPVGVRAPASTRFLDAVAGAHPASVVTSGHTHRHRARRHGPLLVTETGSPKDHPGTWTGYIVYEGGIVQTTRRVMAPEAIEWTQRTAAMGLGQWGRWAPGTLADRCVSHAW